MLIVQRLPRYWRECQVTQPHPTYVISPYMETRLILPSDWLHHIRYPPEAFVPIPDVTASHDLALLGIYMISHNLHRSHSSRFVDVNPNCLYVCQCWHTAHTTVQNTRQSSLIVPIFLPQKISTYALHSFTYIDTSQIEPTFTPEMMFLARRLACYWWEFQVTLPHPSNVIHANVMTV
jgi:hypothetical protein